MYFESEILIDPSDITMLEVPPRLSLARLLSMMMGGWREATNDQELLIGAVLLQCLQQGLQGAGVDDIVRLARDGQLVYHDERGKPADLDAAVAQAQSLECKGFEQLRMVLQHHDDALRYVIDLRVSRVYPVDGIPIRGYVHGFWRDLDTRTIVTRRGGDPHTALTDAIGSRLLDTPEFDGKQAIPERFTATVARIAAALEGALPGARVSHHERPVMLMPRQRWTKPSRLPARVEPEAMAPFSGDPGFREMTFYAHQWGSQCRLHEVSLRHTLLADEAGRPIVRVGDEPLTTTQLLALEPGQPFESMPSLDVIVFTGHDRDAEVRAACLVPPEEDRAGLLARLALREHEQRTLSGYVPTPTPRARATAGSTLGAEIRAAANWEVPSISEGIY